MEVLKDREYLPVIGIDIAPDCIRFVELERIGQDYHLRNFAMAPMPEGGMEDGLILQPRAVAKTIKSVLKEAGFATKNVVAAVRGSKVISRMITLPAMPQDRLRRVIETEINRYVLFSHHDKVVFYHPLEEFDEDGRRKVSIMLVVADKQLCKSYYTTLREAGLNCVALDLSTFAILRVLKNRMPTFKSGSMMSVVYDFNGISLNVFHGETLRFYRSIKMPNMDPAELNNGFMDKFRTEMLLAMQFYQAEYHRGEPIRKIVLSLGATGGMSMLEKLTDQVEGVPVEVHAPFSNIKIDTKQFSAALLERVDFNFITAVGLALRGQESEPLPFRVDLLPTDVADSREFSSLLVKLAIPILLVMIVFGGLLVFTQMQINKIKPETSKLRSDVQEHDRADEAHRNEELKWQGMITEIPSGSQAAVGTTLLKRLQQVTPEKVQLSKLEFSEPDSITIDGSAEEQNSRAAIDDLVGSMTQSKKFVELKKSENSIPASEESPAVRLFEVQGRYVEK